MDRVKALLDTLQAWTDAVDSGQAAPQPTGTQPPAQSVQRLDSFPAPIPTPGPGPGDVLTPTTGRDSIRPSSVSGDALLSHRTPSVAELLSQLRTSQGLEPTYDAVERPADRTTERSFPLPGPPGHGHANTSPTPAPAPQTASAHASEHEPLQDIRSLSFQQALPHISRLMEDPRVIESLSKVTDARCLSCLHFISLLR
jgi:hypothetical protein